MALVDYGGSSDSDSGNEEAESTPIPIVKNQLKSNAVPITSNNKQESPIYKPQTSTLSLQEEDETITPAIDLIDFDEVDDFHQQNGNTFKLNLPETKLNRRLAIEEEEEDDEFLKKKAIPIDEKPPPPPLPQLSQQKPVLAAITSTNSGIKSSGNKKSSSSTGPVKIILPALSTFSELKIKEKPMVTVAPNNTKLTTGLLDMLPKPKSSQFIKTSTSSSATTKRLVPDSISRPKPSVVAKVVNKTDMKSTNTTATTKVITTGGSDSEESDSEDFFSLNREDVLPEVSQDEISAMVANKSAKLREASVRQQKLVLAQKRPSVNENDTEEEEQSYQENHQEIEKEAIQALCGRQQAKRAKRGEPTSVNVIDLSSDQVNPNREEWMRSQLQATTEYQPRGMVDEDPGAGTKRKHQITYLAHQAKANEQELQAMWAANRHARRQTQSKYGF